MRAIVTGAAGFVGSSLVDRLLSDGNEVTGIDCLIPYYDLRLKESNLAAARENPNFEYLQQDLNDAFATPEGAADILDGVDVIFHQAAQAGVRASWGRDFGIYCRCNIEATQKILEALKGRQGPRLVYASTSSVYGETLKFPMEETDLPKPLSPYGVTKLAAEHMVNLYNQNFGVHVVSLRYFTVYGPRQRPDMAFHRLCRSVLTGEEFRLFGDGNQTRDFTFIEDIVQANLDAATGGEPGGVYNLGGGTRISMNDVISMLESIAGRSANVAREGRQHGDVTHTGASTDRAHKAWGFAPKVPLEEGLARELAWVEQVALGRTSP